MFLAQARRLAGLEITAAVDIDLEKARAAFARAGWPEPAPLTTTLDDVLERVEVVVEATGLPRVGVRHALRAIDAGKHIVMVNVEADALVGPELARRAAARGVHLSM